MMDCAFTLSFVGVSIFFIGCCVGSGYQWRRLSKEYGRLKEQWDHLNEAWGRYHAFIDRHNEERARSEVVKR